MYIDLSIFQMYWYLKLILLLLIGYLGTFYVTTLAIKEYILDRKHASQDVNQDGKVDEKDKKIIKDGFIIGKCENVIILTFVIVGEITGLALIFAAKNLARHKAINDNAGYFLAGTLLNFTISLIIGYLLKYTILYVL
jgi:hypothetical protein